MVGLSGRGGRGGVCASGGSVGGGGFGGSSVCGGVEGGVGDSLPPFLRTIVALFAYEGCSTMSRLMWQTYPITHLGVLMIERGVVWILGQRIELVQSEKIRILNHWNGT